MLTTSIENKPLPNTEDINKYIAWNDTLTVNMTGTDGYEFQLSGYNFYLVSQTVYDPHGIRLNTYAQWGPFTWDQQYFTWYDSDSVDYGTTLDTSVIDENPITFNARNYYIGVSVTFGYNSSFASFDDALVNGDGDAYAIFNVDWEDRETSMNALQLVALVITGTLPNVHPVLSFIFGFIGWGIVAAAAYLFFIFILRIVGAVFGGGGA